MKARRDRRKRRPGGWLRAGLLAAVIAVAAAAASAALPARASAGVDDWVHIWEVVRLAGYRQTQAAPPHGVFVYYLGDSTGRESTVSDASWTRALVRKAAAAGKTTVSGAYDLSGHNQTFGMDRKIVEGLPDTPPGQPRGIVLIGVGITRFIGPPTPQDPPTLPLPVPGVQPPLSAWEQHHYDGRRPLPLAHKRDLVPRWMERRWADFRASKRANVAEVRRVVRLCKAKGLRPIIIDLPLDLRVVGAGLDRPRSAIRSSMERLARQHDIRYIRFNRSLGLPSSSYWDLHHLLRSGYERWQERLSAEVVKGLPRAR